MNRSSVVVVGGGPAGLFCAAHTAVGGVETILIEKMDRCGRKLLCTGSGQCNLTHEGDIRLFLSHFGDNGTFIKPALLNFPNTRLISFFTERGVAVSAEPGGKVFPVNRRAGSVLETLLAECTRNGVNIRCNEAVTAVSQKEGRFCVSTGSGDYTGDAVVIATGGMTYPATGSTGDGYHLAAALGHKITDIRPALTSVVIRDYPFSDLSGLSFADLSISHHRGGKKIRQRTGDILFTHTGLSGPGILDHSRFILPGDVLYLSFLPGHDPQQVAHALIGYLSGSGNRLVKTAVGRFDIPERLIRRIFDIAGIPHDLTGSHLTREQRNGLIDLLTRFPFPVGQTGSPDEAMVTAGGVVLPEINPKTMESRLVSGLYCIGEVLDIDGDTGGYNLQAAFSTGYLAAQGILKKVLRDDPKECDNRGLNPG